MSRHDILDGHLIVTQFKTKQPLRIQVTGALETLLDRIRARKQRLSISKAALLVNNNGKRLAAALLRSQFTEARDKAARAHPAMAEQIKKFWFYDLRAKAADDTRELRGEQAASDLLGTTACARPSATTCGAVRLSRQQNDFCGKRGFLRNESEPEK